MSDESTLDLFAPRTAPYQAHSDTSYDAAREIEGDLGALRRQVLDAIVASPEGLTDEEIVAATKMRSNTARPRRIELVKKNLVVDSERRR